MTALDVLFVHNNFPAQFRNLAEKFSDIKGVRVAAIGSKTARAMPGVDLQSYSFSRSRIEGVHPFARRFELESRRAEQVLYSANGLKLSGFSPRLIYAHPGWGEALPLRVLFPDAVIASYSEFYYAPSGTDVGFDREFPRFGVDGEARVVLRNAATLLSLVDADFSIAPTHWQRSVFPREFRPKIHVVHDGLDTDNLVPVKPDWHMPISGRQFHREDEIVTFVARNLEPYRGFHIFMRALPAILKARPNAQICIMGGDAVSYGTKPAHHESWREAMLDELRGQLDLSRVHFLGSVPYEDYRALLARSRAHVYLTYPFVLSWSMLEAMALGCLVIGSDTTPVTEVIVHGENGLLVPFFDIGALAETVIEALADPHRHSDLGLAARQTVIDHYDFRRVSWPRHLELLDAAGCSERLMELLKGAGQEPEA